MARPMTHAHTALVLIDLQRWIVDRPWQPMGGAAVADACGRLREHFAAADSALVVLVRHVQADGADGGLAAAANRPVPGFAVRADEYAVVKHGLDAFEGTGLHEGLRRAAIMEVVLAGLATAYGVEATAATAVRLGYEVTVVPDASASESDAQHHEALDRLVALGVRVRTVDSLVGS
ncbi:MULTISPECIES: cysteine hydrolase family protein [Streptomyces]|uniref:Cysteine hydrolase n=1 Tax=Streptomyces globisporus TaxID=1908 RepID=A0A927BJR4_STRGL|nr:MULTISPECIES: cysteine hydrolase [Streptomyces]MBD2828944.1 cysteine hydrolase [Streptomyces globisporus]MYW76723.1 isochorismatase family protein [Streptomyces sp. SID8369]NEC41271.1 cysteine hydrolase [Streptomyces sp. SID8016]KOU46212.1 hypothetical protein ADK56_30680 [Streptomyces sp. MMG1522]SDE10980.1 Nicotinamidase-related amidase [Streptomyces sp. LaPpAH-199]